jgi:hypothetical protein
MSDYTLTDEDREWMDAPMGPYRAPRLTLRLRWRLAKLRAQVAFNRAFRPHLLWPDWLEGQDGEIVFVRGDLARDEAALWNHVEKQVGAAVVADARGWSGHSVDQVWMKPGPEQEHFDEDWHVIVPEGTPGALLYWRIEW